MSREVMRHLTVFSYKKDTRALIRRLTQLRCVDIQSTELEGSDEVLSFDRPDTVEDKRRAEETVETVDRALGTLYPYKKRKRRSKKEVDISDFMTGERYSRAQAAVRDTERASAQLSELCTAEKEKREFYGALLPFEAYPRPLGLRGTEYTEMILGSLPAGTDYSAFLRSIEGFYAMAERVYCKEKSPIFVCIISHVSDTRALCEMLSEYSFQRVEFPESFSRASREIARVRAELAEIAERKGQTRAKLSALAGQSDEIEILYDVEKTTLGIIEQEMKLGQTEHTDVLCAWVPSSAEKRVAMALEAFDAAYEFREAREDEAPPELIVGNCLLRRNFFKRFYERGGVPFEAAAPSEKYIIEK